MDIDPGTIQEILEATGQSAGTLRDLKTLRDSLRGFIGEKKISEAAVAEILKDINVAIADIQRDHTSIEVMLTRLKLEAERASRFDDKLANYRLTKTAAGAPIFEPTEVGDGAHHAICPTCVNDNRIEYLHTTTSSNIYRCLHCKSQIVKHVTERKPNTRRGGAWIDR